MADIIGNGIFNRIPNINNINQLKLESTYSKISLRTEVKSPGCVNTYKKYKKYKKSY